MVTYTGMLTGPYGVGTGSLAGIWTDPSPVPSFMSFDALEAEAAREAAANGWNLGANTQVWFIVSTALDTQGDCGLHDLGGAEGEVVAVSERCQVSITLAHEYAEAATDPDGYDGYVTEVSSTDDYTEIADVCGRGGWALSPAGLLPMIYQPGLGCTWGNWAPTLVWGGGAPVETIPNTWTQCTATVTCGAWLFYPSAMTTPTGISKWNDVSGGFWVIVPG